MPNNLLGKSCNLSMPIRWTDRRDGIHYLPMTKQEPCSSVTSFFFVAVKERNIKLPLYTPRRLIGGVEVWFHSYLTLTLLADEWYTPHPGLLARNERAPPQVTIGYEVGWAPRARLDGLVKRRTVQPVISSLYRPSRLCCPKIFIDLVESGIVLLLSCHQQTRQRRIHNECY